MLLGQGRVFRGQFRVCLSGLRGHVRYQAGLRTIGYKHKINAPWKTIPSLPTQRKSKFNDKFSYYIIEFMCI